MFYNHRKKKQAFFGDKKIEQNELNRLIPKNQVLV